MPERTPSLPNDWNIESVSESLNSQPDEIQDVNLGLGKRFQVGESRLDLYPSSSTTRLVLPALKLQIENVNPPTAALDSVIFSPSETSPIFLKVSSQGEVVLFAAKTPTPSPEPVASPAEPVTQPSSPEIQSSDEAKKEPRISLSGRVGRPPTLRSTRKGTSVARFPLGVRHDDETTTWHTIMAFGERAEKLKESIKKGDMVDVIGYLHQGKSRSGKTRTEVYAAVVTLR